MDNRFFLEIPTKIEFGRHILKEAVANALKGVQGKVLVITGGKSAKACGYLDIVKEAVKESNEFFLYEGIHSNPKVKEIDRAIEIGVKEKIDCIIGLGGGSALDAAKVIAAGVGMEKKCDDFLYNKVIPDEKTLPIIAIPTTAGTGSELSKGAIITDEKNQIKKGIRSEYLYPKYAIVDSTLTYSVPFSITMETGFDVLAHAIESYISRKAFMFSAMLSEEVIKDVSKNLRRLAENLNDFEARDMLSYDSMLMGINLGNVGTALPHRLQYPIGALTDTGHGTGLALLYPSWIENTYIYSADKFNKVLQMISGRCISTCETAVIAMNKFLCEINLNNGFESLGLKPDNKQWLIEHVTGSIVNDPGADDEGIIDKIYEGMFRRVK